MKDNVFKKDVPWILFIGIVVIVWFSHVIFSNSILAYRDLARYFYPLRNFGTEAIKGLHIPLWNPYLSCGKPFLAVLQTVVFYPLSIIYYTLPSFDVSFNWYIIVHFFLAGLFMYYLIRHWNISRPAAFASSIIFICSGYLSSVIDMNTSLSSAVWIPAIFLFFDKALKEKKFRFILITGLLLGFQFLGGEPTLFYCSFWLLLFYTLGFIWIHYKKHIKFTENIRPIFIFTIVFIIFVLVCMFQILPFCELIANSTLAEGRSLDAASKWSLTPVELFSFLIPYIRGDITVPDGHFETQLWMISFYVGIPVLILIAVLFFFKQSKKAYFFGAALLGSLLLALGKYTPLYPFLYKFLPGLSGIRYPVKFLFVTTFSLSILAGMGLESILKEQRVYEKQKLTKYILLINLLLAVCLGVFIVFWQEIGSYLMRFFLKNNEVSGYMLHKYNFVYLNSSRYFCQFFIIFTAASFLIITYLNKKIAKGLFVFLILLLIFGDLVGVNMGITKAMDRKHFSLIPNSVKKIKEDDSLFRIFQDVNICNVNSGVWGSDYGSGLYDRKKTFMCQTAMPYGIYYNMDYGSIRIKDPYDFILFLTNLPPEVKAKLLNLLNIKYIISTQPIDGTGMEVVYKDTLSYLPIMIGGELYNDFYINKNSNVMERAFLADDAVFVDDKSIALGIMQSENFDPKKVVVLEAEPKESRHAKVSKYQGENEYAKIIKYMPEEVIIETYVNSPKWLVLSDTYYPGWKVFVDGKEDKIYKADYFLRAVYLSPGKHIVKFIYNPFSFKLGSIISVVSLLGILMFFVFSKKRLSL